MYRSGTQLLNPEIVIQKSHIQPGMHVGDFGCGSTGHLLFQLAHHVTDQGKVYGVDIKRQALDAIRSRSEHHGVSHVYPVWSNIERVGATAIPPGTLDIGYVVMTLHQVEELHSALIEILRLLKYKSRLVIIDWLPHSPLFGTCAARYIPPSYIKNWALHQGLRVQEEFTVSHHFYGFVLYRHE